MRWGPEETIPDRGQERVWKWEVRECGPFEKPQGSDWPELTCEWGVVGDGQGQTSPSLLAVG